MEMVMQKLLDHLDGRHAGETSIKIPALIETKPQSIVDMAIAVLAWLCSMTPILDATRHLAVTQASLSQRHLELRKARCCTDTWVAARRAVNAEPFGKCHLLVALITNCGIMTDAERQVGNSFVLGASTSTEIRIFSYKNI